MVAEEQYRGGVSAMIFSDCAYIDLQTPLRAALGAIDLMATFIELDIPVRMGIGLGTFYGFKYSIDTAGGPHMVTKALFAGTAVINAHSAEQCGGKGCRIFVHDSVASELSGFDSHFKTMPMPIPTPNARLELVYLPPKPRLFRMDPRHGRKRWMHQDLFLVQHVRHMAEESESASESVGFQYSETLAAIDRMRAAWSRRDTLADAELWEDGAAAEEEIIEGEPRYRP
jgi:hypothetical protein